MSSSTMEGLSKGGEGEISTQSRVRMLWLTKVGGYRIVRISQMPAQGWFGGLRYSYTWWLRLAGK
jgi:hypothetical protein